MERTVVIVDDFKTNVVVMKTSLINAGFKVLSAEDPKDALAFFNGQKIDLMISDFKMPGMTGAELTKEVKSKPQYKNMPVIILSSEKSQQCKLDARAAGAYGWLNKPFNIERFNQIVDSLFES